MLRGAHIHIQADYSLAETARILAATLDVSLKEDDSGYYEEFPAFSGYTRGLQFALLGLPDQVIMGQEPYKDFHLHVLPMTPEAMLNPELGRELYSRIIAQGQLRVELWVGHEEDT